MNANKAKINRIRKCMERARRDYRNDEEQYKEHHLRDFNVYRAMLRRLRDEELRQEILEYERLTSGIGACVQGVL